MYGVTNLVTSRTGGEILNQNFRGQDLRYWQALHVTMYGATNLVAWWTNGVLTIYGVTNGATEVTNG